MRWSTRSAKSATRTDLRTALEGAFERRHLSVNPIEVVREVKAAGWRPTTAHARAVVAAAPFFQPRMPRTGKPLSGSTIANHLAILRRAGIVTGQLRKPLQGFVGLFQRQMALRDQERGAAPGQ